MTILTGVGSQSKFPVEVKVVRTDFSATSLGEALRDQGAVVSTVTHMAFDKQEFGRVLPSPEYGGDNSCQRLSQAAPFTMTKWNATTSGAS